MQPPKYDDLHIAIVGKTFVDTKNPNADIRSRACYFLFSEVYLYILWILDMDISKKIWVKRIH
jgi:hypothetical protein